MAILLRSTRAIADLDDIWFYIAEDSVAAADQWLSLLMQKAMLLSEQPLMGRARPEVRPGLRSLPVAAYMLYYRPVDLGPEGAGIELVRVLHSSRDIEPGLMDNP